MTILANCTSELAAIVSAYCGAMLPPSELLLIAMLSRPEQEQRENLQTKYYRAGARP